MNKRFLPVLLTALALVTVLALCVTSCKEESDKIAATFDLEENMGCEYGKQLPIAFTLNDNNVTKVELIYNDSVFQTWKSPKKKTSYLLKADYYGVGAKELILRATLSDGTTEEDTRLIRVLSDISPKPMVARVIAPFPHDQTSYTQGLEFSNGELFEGTGNPQNGMSASIIGKIDLPTGKILLKNGLDATNFGEGITILGNEIFQLTWKNGKCYVYDRSNLQLKLKEFNYTGEGWGLCNDGKQLIMSDGTERITFRNPANFNPVRTIEVYDNQGPLVGLNELEYINGKIYANIYTTDIVIVIDPFTGKVLEEIDASGLAAAGKMGGEVLNGIAHNPLTNKTYMTGKYWGKLLEVEMVER